MAEIILGIDPGTRITGYGIIEVTHEIRPIDFGCIRPPPQLPLHERYLIIFNSLEQLVEKFAPQTIVVESQFVKKNAQSALKLGMAKGMVLLVAAKNRIPIFEYAPKKAKLAIVGTGMASKQQVQSMLRILLKLPTIPTPEDAADALALAICHAHKSRIQLCLNTSRVN